VQIRALFCGMEDPWKVDNVSRRNTVIPMQGLAGYERLGYTLQTDKACESRLSLVGLVLDGTTSSRTVRLFVACLRAVAIPEEEKMGHADAGNCNPKGNTRLVTWFSKTETGQKGAAQAPEKD